MGDITAVIDTIESTLVDVVARFPVEDRRLTYLAFAPVWNSEHLRPVASPEAAGVRIDAVDRDVLATALPQLERVGSMILQAVAARENLMYTATSYWSPLDGLRRTLLQMAQHETETGRERAIALIYAFYAMTIAGCATKPRRVSAIQHMGTSQQRLSPLRVTFAKEQSIWQTDRWFRLGDDAWLWYKRQGFDDVIDDLMHRHDSAEIEMELAKMLAPGLASAPMDLADCGRRLVSLCEIAGADGAGDDLLGRMMPGFQAWAGEPIDRSQVSAILASYLQFAAATAADNMYAFPVYVGSAGSFFTVGSREPLPDGDLLLLRNATRALFSYALLEDYAVHEGQREAARRTNVFRRFLGHNLPKVLIGPAGVELHTIQLLLDANDDDHRAIARSVKRLQVLFEHYDRVMASFMPAADDALPFTAPVEPVNVQSDLIPRVAVAFDMLRERVLNRQLRDALTLEFVAELDSFRGHSAFVVEMLFNLLANAIDAVSPVRFRVEPDVAVIRLRIASAVTPTFSACIVLEVVDSGVGFSSAARETLRRQQEKLLNATRDNFAEVLERMFDHDGAPGRAREEHMGLGLVFSCAYLRALEWHEDIGRGGSLTIHDRDEGGTRVVAVVPIPVSRSL